MHKLVLCSPLRSRKQGQLPVSPFVSVAIGTHSEVDGQLLLTAQLMTESEIDYEVDSLVKELEEFRKNAKKEIRTLSAKMLGD